ncbi:SMEK domain-containing protein [Clostridium sp. MB40-C1]|uniref:SMEK domain-containing protein n=1 Tax=Clostridium sp. MB40-C1 TaxID=3070996 RepID=UPI0027E14DAA|nr:SMEK domain-containing protein [Clostridium sp. MB40-C1]WMJ81462.1 SMEK domain-containing protein [Clostridium sp. MB40-C1]
MIKSAAIIDEIVQYLSILKYYIEIENKIEYFDINKKSEDFFCELLNLVYNLELKNLNKLQVNFPAIDIADNKKRICYQITSTSTIEKIRHTLNKFREKKLYEEYDCINIFILGNKNNHRTKLVYKEFKFNYKDNLLDINDLAKEIAKKSRIELDNILEFFETEFSDSIIKKIQKSDDDKSIYISETTLEDKHICYYAYGLGKVRIDAYLPTNIEQQLSCRILFKQPGLSDCMFSFDESLTKTILFIDSDKGLIDKRQFIWYIDGDKVGVKFPNNRFITDKETAQQLCILISKLHKYYSARKQSLCNVVGATNFKEENGGEFKIIRMPISIWSAMVDFAQKHDHFSGDTKWHIFRPLNLLKKNHIIIYKNHLNITKGDILAELHVKDISSYYVDIIWKQGYTPLLNKMDGFDNIIKWKADFTHNWILNEFVPYIFYLNITKSRSVFERLCKNKVTFEEFKTTFSYSAYNIESLALKNSETRS